MPRINWSIPLSSRLGTWTWTRGFLAPSMMIVASKWSRPLKELKIGKYQIGITHPLVDLHELRKLDLVGWRMEKNNDALRRLSWTLNGISILSHLSMIPLAKSLCHKLDFLVLRGVHQTNPSISPECHIQIARHLDLIFPYVGSISVRDSDWSGFMTWSSFARTPDEVSRMQGKWCYLQARYSLFLILFFCFYY